MVKPRARFAAALVACSLAPAASAQALTARNYLQRMSPGINLGTTLEAIPTATSWGNPPPTDPYFRAVKAAGFKSVRIPVAWSQYADKNHFIGPNWMAHVTEVVRKATRAGGTSAWKADSFVVRLEHRKIRDRLESSSTRQGDRRKTLQPRTLGEVMTVR